MLPRTARLHNAAHAPRSHILIEPRHRDPWRQDNGLGGALPLDALVYLSQRPTPSGGRTLAHLNLSANAPGFEWRLSECAPLSHALHLAPTHSSLRRLIIL